MRRLALTGSLLVGALLAACGTPEFPEAAPRDWRDKPEFDVESGPQPQIPGEPQMPGSPRDPGRQEQQDNRPPEGCTDFNQAVIATCLDPVSALAVLPGDLAVLAAERSTGRVLRIEDPEADPVELITLDVDAGTDGGLTGLALSPSYVEDELIFAYLTTPTDNRVVRFAPGDEPKPVLTGIPRGETGNAGAILADERGGLLVATGDAGDPAAAGDPTSLAGKLLRIDSTGEPLTEDPESAVVATGLHRPGGLCLGLDGESAWVTDRGPDQDVIYEIKPAESAGEPVADPRWNWPDRPGVAGCFVSQNGVVVALTDGAALFDLPLAPDGTVIGNPQVLPDNPFGRLSAMATTADRQAAFIGTVNKDGGEPVSSDDRVFLFLESESGGGDGID